ncbi:transforming acidic coiled-coil-containing protein 1 [Onthophagus taurus]|uniref:transforming acidic coiled-coil-containing protein 1 n=1 Tax=Onthophagus taurus TaxID=166361 RepID=UPI000C209CF8|nr:transforming acidic coiled-coil-containing protein 1 [Onthophagus taurus]XP_022902245.1 transforming acidic coiled-coil-containing protein 1 [Onthophagus taurus]
MTDLNDKIALQEQEISDLKLQLNQYQQGRATLDLQLRQKEEVIIKTEAEAQRKEMQYKQEIRQLKEKLEAQSEVKEDDDVKVLKENLDKMKIREEKLLDQLNKLSTEEDGFKQVMDEYEKTISEQVSEIEKLKKEHETAKRHLATLEIAFSDVHQKYERSKGIIEGYKHNEEMLQQSLMLANENIRKNEDKYESLKAHAKAQIDKSNRELNSSRERYQGELHKLSAIVKRLEIKNSSLANALEQKTKECAELAALCDEVTGRVE